jgi:uncharacterized protein YacL
MFYNEFGKNVSYLRAGIFLVILEVLSLPVKIFAAGTKVTGMPTASLPTSVNIDSMLGKIQKYFFGALIVACIFMIIWGAFDIATAGDNEEKVKSAKKRILYASVGVVIGGISSAIVSLLLSIF